MPQIGAGWARTLRTTRTSQPLRPSTRSLGSMRGGTRLAAAGRQASHPWASRLGSSLGPSPKGVRRSLACRCGYAEARRKGLRYGYQARTLTDTAAADISPSRAGAVGNPTAVSFVAIVAFAAQDFRASRAVRLHRRGCSLGSELWRALRHLLVENGKDECPA